LIDGQRKWRCVREIRINDILNSQIALYGHRPLGDLLADIAGTDALSA